MSIFSLKRTNQEFAMLEAPVIANDFLYLLQEVLDV